MSANQVNRRDFIGGVAWVSGGLAVSASMPWLAGAVAAAQPTLAHVDDFRIDDVWTGLPRYAEPIPYPRRQTDGRTAAVGSIDALFHA